MLFLVTLKAAFGHSSKSLSFDSPVVIIHSRFPKTSGHHLILVLNPLEEKNQTPFCR